MRISVGRIPGPRPVCDYGFYAAHALAQAEWRSWVESEGESARRLDQARKTAQGADERARRPGMAAVVDALREIVGSVLIGLGQRVQGVPATTRAASA